MKKISPRLQALVIGFILGTVYGLTLRYFMGLQEPSGFATAMSIAFLFIGPLAIGTLSVQSATETKLVAFFWPFVPVLFGCAIAAVIHVEGLICIVMYLPAGLLLAGLGGLAKRYMLRRGRKNAQYAILILPFVLGPVEGKFVAPVVMHDVRSEIVIHAPSERVWSEIKSVRTITRDELADSWVHKMGFPRPLDAVIDHEGVGGIRLARFEGQLVFNETVTEWDMDRLLSFQIVVDPKSIPPTTLDEHVTIGGKYFDVLQGTYELEPQGQTTILHLKSRFRLSTDFNTYAEIWSTLIMNRIQSDILSVIKKRAETAFANDPSASSKI